MSHLFIVLNFNKDFLEILAIFSCLCRAEIYSSDLEIMVSEECKVVVSR